MKMQFGPGCGEGDMEALRIRVRRCGGFPLDTLAIKMKTKPEILCSRNFFTKMFSSEAINYAKVNIYVLR